MEWYELFLADLILPKFKSIFNEIRSIDKL